MDAAAWIWWCNDLGSRCSDVGLVFDRGLWCFIYFYLFGVDGRLWVARGGGCVRCVQCSGGGDCGS